MFLLSRCERAVWSATEIASSVVLFGQYANWSVSRISGIIVLVCAMTSLSEHFMATDVSATGQDSYRQVTLEFLGTGTMVVCFKYVGITDSDRERLKMAVKTVDSKDLPVGQRMLEVHVLVLCLVLRPCECCPVLRSYIGYGERDHTVIQNS